MEMGKTGDMDINFSDDMVFPDSWAMKSGRRLSSLGDDIQFWMKKPNKNGDVQIPSDNVILVGDDPKKLGFKVEFANPSLISLSSQSESDQIVIKFGKDFVLNDKNGNSLVFDAGENGGDSIDFGVPVQTQVDDQNEGNQMLQGLASTLKVLTLIVIIGQLAVSFITGSGLEHFYSLINSQQSIAYLAVLSVNNPGPVNYYLDAMHSVGTLSPFAQADWESNWDFQWTKAQSLRVVFARLGMDRVFVHVLGNLCVFAIIFVSLQFAIFLLSFFTDMPRVDKLYQFLKMRSSFKPVAITIVLLLYTHFLFGSLLNTENESLLRLSSNWGFNGNLNFSDQFTILLGYAFYLMLVVFPFLVAYTLLKRTSLPHMTNERRIEFLHTYQCLFEPFKHQNLGVHSFLLATLARKTLFVLVAFYFWKPHQVLFQIVANILLSFTFCIYLTQMTPFRDRAMNRI
jgi:hypothetical protein